MPVVSLAFLAIGMTNSVSNNHPISWVAIVVSGLCLIVIAINFYPKSFYLKLSKDGFEMCSLFKSHFTPWSDVEQFGVGNLVWKKSVTLNYKPHVSINKLLKAVNKLVTGGWDGGLPDSYGLTHTQLADLLNSYLKK